MILVKYEKCATASSDKYRKLVKLFVVVGRVWLCQAVSVRVSGRSV
jgi:hypothetical protein